MLADSPRQAPVDDHMTNNERTIEDPVLGRIAYEAEYDYFSGRIRWCGAEVDLILDAVDGAVAPGALELTRRVVAQAEDLDERHRAAAEEDLYGTYEAQARGPHRTREAFRAALRPSVLNVNDGECYDFAFDDAGLLGGMEVHVDSMDGGKTLNVGL